MTDWFDGNTVDVVPTAVDTAIVEEFIVDVTLTDNEAVLRGSIELKKC